MQINYDYFFLFFSGMLKHLQHFDRVPKLQSLTAHYEITSDFIT